MIEKFNFLRQTLFYADTFVLTSVLAAYCLLAIWAALSPRHWFLRASALVLSLLVLLPIQAHQPMLTLSIALLILWFAIYLGQRRWNLAQGVTEPKLQTLRMHFGMSDLLLGVLAAGAVCYAVTILIARRNELDLIRALASGASIALFAGLCCVFVLCRRKWFTLIVIVFLAIPAAYWHEELSLLGAKDLLAILRFQGLFFDMDAFLTNAHPEATTIVSLAMTAFGVILTGALVLSAAIRMELRASSHRAIRGIAAALGFGWLAAIVLLYAHLAADGRSITEDDSEPNSYHKLIAVAQEVERLNPNAESLFNLGSTAQGRAPVPDLERAYEEGLQAASEPGHFPVGDLLAHFQFVDLQGVTTLHGLAKCWVAQGEALESRGRHDEAARFYLALIQIGSISTRGGSTTHLMTGDSLARMGSSRLIPLRNRISPECAQRLLPQLFAIDESRESAKEIATRDAAWARISGGWLTRFAYDMAMLCNRPMVESYFVEQQAKERDTEFRLLLIDLALRLHKEERGTLPAELKELTPSYLKSLPADPYSGQPFIYRPQGETLVLYSVWRGGIDDGGRFGTQRESSASAGFDRRLEYEK